MASVVPGPACAEFAAAVDACDRPGPSFVDLSPILNHVVDAPKLFKVCQEAVESLGVAPDAVLTAPTSGNALAALFGLAANCSNVVLAKSGVPLSWVESEVAKADVPSRTVGGLTRTLCVKRAAIARCRRVVVVDDVLGHGATALGLLRLARDAGAVVTHVIVFVEKTGTEHGRKAVQADFPDVEIVSLATAAFEPAEEKSA